MTILIALIGYILGYLTPRTLVKNTNRQNYTKNKTDKTKHPTKKEIQEWQEIKWLDAFKKAITRDKTLRLDLSKQDDKWSLYIATEDIVCFVHFDILNWLSTVSLHELTDMLAYYVAKGKNIDTYLKVHLFLSNVTEERIYIENNKLCFLDAILQKFYNTSWLRYLQKAQIAKIASGKQASAILGNDYYKV